MALLYCQVVDDDLPTRSLECIKDERSSLLDHPQAGFAKLFDSVEDIDFDDVGPWHVQMQT